MGNVHLGGFLKSGGDTIWRVGISRQFGKVSRQFAGNSANDQIC